MDRQQVFLQVIQRQKNFNEVFILRLVWLFEKYDSVSMNGEVWVQFFILLFFNNCVI